jgi:hypothetical protein
MATRQQKKKRGSRSWSPELVAKRQRKVRSMISLNTQLGFDLNDLAKQVGCSRSSLHKYSTGQQTPGHLWPAIEETYASLRELSKKQPELPLTNRERQNGGSKPHHPLSLGLELTYEELVKGVSTEALRTLVEMIVSEIVDRSHGQTQVR